MFNFTIMKYILSDNAFRQILRVFQAWKNTLFLLKHGVTIQSDCQKYFPTLCIAISVNNFKKSEDIVLAFDEICLTLYSI